jgi:hypothetical protein
MQIYQHIRTIRIIGATGLTTGLTVVLLACGAGILVPGVASAASRTAPVPDGPPRSEVGRYLDTVYGRRMLETWDNNPGGQCGDRYPTSEGKIRLVEHGIDLITTGRFNNCAQEMTDGNTFGYGIYEAEMWVQGVPGTHLIANWPAFYSVGPDWPAGGELDAMEAMNGQDGMSYHYGRDNSTVNPDTEPAMKPGWNTVDVVYKPHYMAVYYNGKRAWVVPRSVVTDQPVAWHFQSYTGDYGYTTGKPSTLEIRYFRVWSVK